MYKLLTLNFLGVRTSRIKLRDMVSTKLGKWEWRVGRVQRDMSLLVMLRPERKLFRTLTGGLSNTDTDVSYGCFF